VHRAVVAALLHRDAGRRERTRVRLPLVAQDVLAHGEHERRRQPAQIGRVERRRVRVATVGAVEVEVPVALHVLCAEAEALAALAVGRRVERAVADGVDKRLEAEGGAALVAQPARGHRCEVAAGGVPCDRHAAGIGVELGGVRGEPVHRGAHVVGRGRERVLRGEPVVDARDHGARRVRERPAQRIEAVERADRPAAAVQVGHERQRALALRPERAHRDRAPGAGQRDVAHLGDVRSRPAQPLGVAIVRRARLLDGHEVRRRPGRGLHQVHERLDLGIEHARKPTA
jgi:hypothetical protein